MYSTPHPTRALRTALSELDKLRARLGDATGVAGPWIGQIRRTALARSVESSVSIEGFTVPPGRALALVAGTVRPDPGSDDQMAIACYARAMDHIGTLAIDPRFRWLDRVIFDLHFDACHFQRDRAPGLLRTGSIVVTATSGGTPAFVGPDAGDVPTLVDEVVDWFERGDLDAHVAVRAAMAHLHLVSVHPFRDGNGRISRLVQSLVLAREGLLAPEFCSIEEYLGGATDKYYRVVQQVQGGSYQPHRDATPWVRFCIEAHIHQARQRLDQVAEAARRWTALEDIAKRRGWPDRMVVAMEQSLFHPIDRSSYVDEADVSPATASADLRRLLDAGLLAQEGRGRNVRYTASEDLRRMIA